MFNSTQGCLFAAPHRNDMLQTAFPQREGQGRCLQGLVGALEAPRLLLGARVLARSCMAPPPLRQQLRLQQPDLVCARQLLELPLQLLRPILAKKKNDSLHLSNRQG